MRRGEIWWAELGPPAGRRPVVLLSRQSAYAARCLVTVAPVTTRIRRIRSEVLLNPSDGMTRECVANLDTITTVPKERLRERVAVLSPAKLAEVNAAIHFALGLE